ncbi:Protein ANTAGONIST OF LIKE HETEROCHROMATIN PROTEIN 1 [Anabarilius grahami]|uniref:Protein ANTAGONIST OF LIKE HETEROCHROMATIN PROTEIN 1 n=1 Tax=Anabarilius grahami TaxID=495550 RepID=A0A3N0Z3C1_ANAGA|nr:Protein ANTAGONIST OF LIKE HETEROCHROMATIN PROTEIN 1 [Anabarilius grahami]
MDYLDYFNDNQRPPPRPERRLLKDRSNPLNDFDDLHFLDRFRMSKENATAIIGLLQPKLSGDLVRGTPISPSLQILITLRFLACGTFHRETGDLCGVGESTVCKIVHKVCSAICELKKDFIKFPKAAEQATYKVDFYEYGNFPGVIGCIDGCHIPIKCPSTADAEEFRNRKNWFSINVQGVCTPTMQFSNIVARWKVRPEQQRYNQAHMLTRGLIERMFGVWKNRFQCLRNTLRFEPRRCCIVIIATAVLHNFLKQCGCPDPDIEDDDDQHVPIAELANDRNGLAYRDAFALQHFS